LSDAFARAPAVRGRERIEPAAAWPPRFVIF
jgi:hypothetical protein